jgi:gliding motility-associated-like protein
MKLSGNICWLLCLAVQAQAQPLFFNNGARLHMNPGSLMIVKTNSLENYTGRIDNAGNLIIEGDFTNNDIATGNATSTGIYDIYGNWINNAAFTADQSTVQLSGTNQLITGTQKTAFYNLFLTGNGIKTQTIDSEVRGILDIRDAELATSTHEMLVSNPSPGAILRNSGFVSSLADGRLSRNTDQAAPYLYPTGSSLGTTRYRPVVITPAANNSNIFGARLANTDATGEGFDRNNKEPLLCNINPLYYHRLYHSAGNDAAAVSLFYDSPADGNWTTVAHWQGNPRWEDIGPVARTTASGFEVMTIDNWNDFSLPAFALANPAPSVQVFQDTTIVLGESVGLSSLINAAVNTFSWSPPYHLSCIDCPDPIASPEQTTLYVLTVNQGQACQAADSVLIRVIQNQNLFLPNAFSPNGDGINEVLRLYGNTDRIYTLNLRIFDRWGEKVFEADKIEKALAGWDGTYLGKLLDPGVFTYHLKVTFKSGIADPLEKKGSLVLIR